MEVIRRVLKRSALNFKIILKYTSGLFLSITGLYILYNPMPPKKKSAKTKPADDSEAEVTFEQSEISISHRLPSRQGQIPPIIVKFVRRDMRDKIYKMRRGLSSKTALHLGYHLESRLFINESLTQQSRALLRAAKAFKRDHHYKFVWTKYGKILLKKEATPSSEVLSFSSLKEFEDFEAKVNER